jgi:DNA polymerase I
LGNNGLNYLWIEGFENNGNNNKQHYFYKVLKCGKISIAFLLRRSTMKKLLLIDGNSLLFRAFHATAYSGTIMRNSKGVPTNALYGFTVMMLNVLEKYEFSNILVAFDAGKQTFRHEEYKEYKGGRKPVVPELIEQMPLARQLLEQLQIKHYELINYEADDIIGTMSKIAAEEGFDHVDILSSDHDLLQLIQDCVHVNLTQKGLSEIETYSVDYLKEKMGITPSQITDLKGLMGDSSDNIPGIPGVGEKTALKLLAEYQTVENLLDHIDDLKGKLKEKVEQNQDLARLSKKLATIDCAVPLEITLEDTKYEPFNPEDIVPFFNEYDFHSLIKRINANQKQVKTKVDFSFEIIKDEQKLDGLLEENSMVIVEAYGQNYHQAEVLGIAIVNEKGKVYIPIEVMESSLTLQSFLANSKIKKATFDYKKAYVALKKQGFTLLGVDFDLLTAAYIINPSISDPDFRIVSSNFEYNEVNYDEEIYGKNTKYSKPDVEVVAEHAVKKAVGLSLLKDDVLKRLNDFDQEKLYFDLELPLTLVLSEMELAGIKLDISTIDHLSQDFEERIKNLEAKIQELAGKSFNVGSPKQLGEVLFEDLKLPVIKKTKTGYSTNVDVLEKLQGEHPIIELIMEYRTLTKLFSTYVVGLKQYVYEDGKIHTIFNQTLTQTGRLSSTEPNIQNIPIRYEEGRLIRKAFVPSLPENYILAADYSQIELRVLAHLANTENLIEAFVNNIDIHTKTAMDVFGVKQEEVTSLMRRQAKAVNFGIIYGISAFGLSENLHIQPKEAQAFIDKYLETYPGIKGFMEKMVQDAKDTGYAETIFKRRRYIEELTSRNYNIRMFGERTAMNAPIQGSAADIIKIAMINLAKRMEQEQVKSKMLVQVHDELIFDVVPDELELMQKIVQEEMEGAVSLLVPLKVEMNHGKSWYEAK